MIYDLETVDLLTTAKDDPTLLCLGVTDEIQWEHHIDEHLWLLQEKLNRYVTFILNRGYEASIPNRVFEKFVITIYFACSPNEQANDFLRSYQAALEQNGISIQIRYEIVSPEN